MMLEAKLYYDPKKKFICLGVKQGKRNVYVWTYTDRILRHVYYTVDRDVVGSTIPYRAIKLNKRRLFGLDDMDADLKYWANILYRVWKLGRTTEIDNLFN